MYLICSANVHYRVVDLVLSMINRFPFHLPPILVIINKLLSNSIIMNNHNLDKPAYHHHRLFLGNHSSYVSLNILIHHNHIANQIRNLIRHSISLLLNSLPVFHHLIHRTLIVFYHKKDNKYFLILSVYHVTHHYNSFLYNNI